MPAKSTPPDPSRENAHLQDMLASSRLVQDYVDGVSRAAFLQSSEKQDAVAMRLAVIGEAAQHVSDDTAGKLPTIPFPAIRAMRHRIAHDYGMVDAAIVWEIAQNDLPTLILTLEQFKSTHP